VSQIATVILAAVLSVGGSVVVALLLLYLTARTRRSEQREQYRREDQVAQAIRDAAAAQQAQADAAAGLVRKVANDAADAASNLQAAQAETIRRTNEVARLAAEQAVQANGTLDGISAQLGQVHTLVNQRLTDITERALAATVALLSAREEMAQRTLAAGGRPTESALDLIEATRREIAELQDNLAARAVQQAAVDQSVSDAAADDG
jgi:hypothetical protein